MRLIDADAMMEKYNDWYTEDGEPDGVVCTVGCLLRKEPTVGGWISVKERMPMLIEPVLFTGKNAHGGSFLTQRGYFDGTFWRSDSVGTVYATTPVTHWMPLPEPPEENSNEI